MGTTAQPATSPFAALQSGDFRLYIAGQLVSLSGTWMQSLAQGFLVFQLTQSEAWLGVVACAAGLPFVVLAPIAGVIVERVPRRRLLQMAQAVQMTLALILATLTFTGMVQVGHIVFLAFLLGMTNALDMPARQTFVIELVGPDHLRSGIALNSTLHSSSRVLGPMAAGIALVQLGPAWCFLLNGISFLASIFMLSLMRVPYAIECKREVKPMRQLKEGLAFARNHPVIAPLLLLATVSGISLIPMIQIMPAFADVVLKSAKEGYAALSITEGAGSVIAGVSVGWLALRLGYGRLIAFAVMLAAFATIMLALQTTIPAAAMMSLLSGISIILVFVSVNTTIQMVVPNDYRGRVMALYTLSFMGIAPFSALLLGFVASLIGTPGAMIAFALFGGIANIAVLLRWPGLLKSV